MTSVAADWRQFWGLRSGFRGVVTGVQEWLSAENWYGALEILTKFLCAGEEDSIELAGHVRLLSSCIEKQLPDTKTEAWEGILTVFKEKFRPIYWTRLIETAIPDVGVLEGKVQSHAEG